MTPHRYGQPDASRGCRHRPGLYRTQQIKARYKPCTSPADESIHAGGYLDALQHKRESWGRRSGPRLIVFVFDADQGTRGVARGFAPSTHVIGETACVGLARPLGDLHRLGSYFCGVAWNDGAWLSFALNWKSAQSTGN